MWSTVRDIAAATGIPALLLYWLRDRRRARADASVQEGTVGTRIGRTGVEYLEAQVIAMARAFDEERDSKDRRISDLSKEVRQLRQDVSDRDGLITGLRDQLEEMREQMEQMRDRMAALSEQLPHPND